VTPERWRQIREIFDSALERDPKDRSGFLLEACNGDTAMHAEVLSLIASFDSSQTDSWNVRSPPISALRKNW